MGAENVVFLPGGTKNHPLSISGEHFPAFPRVLQHFTADNVLRFGKRRNKEKE